MEKKIIITKDSITTISYFLKNSNGEYLWHFSWMGGGFNSVWAKTRIQALKKIKKEFTLVPDENTLVKATPEMDNQMTRIMNMITC